MKGFIDLILKLYLVPLQWSNRLALYAKGKIFSYDEHYVCTLDVIRRYFPDDRNPVVDIGAFDGDSTSYFAKRLPQNLIFGFEPNPGPYKKSLTHLSTFQNIEFHNLAFADRNGEAELFVTNDLVSSSLLKLGATKEFRSKEIVKVQVTTLDDFFKDHAQILLLKLDVQGAELKVLSKGDNTLRKTKLVLTEVLNDNLYEDNCYYHEVDIRLRALGFKIHTIISDYNFEGTKYFDILYINTAFSFR